MKKLLADSGSTKTDWTLIDENGRVIATCKTQGVNPFHLQDEEVLRVLTQELSLPERPQEVDFYGSGVTEAMKPRMLGLLRKAFGVAKVSAESDMMGAARALLGKQAGIACILGTGANSCLYDGKNIVMNTPPLGYILGDEGSGAVLGKLFLNGVLKGILPVSLKAKYMEWSGLDYATIINKVYRQPLANRFLASIAPFISSKLKGMAAFEDGSEEKEEAVALYRMVLEAFTQFYDHNIVAYVERMEAIGENVPSVGFVGSVAYHFQDPLRNVFEDEHHLSISKILRSPMEGLVKYHSEPV